MIIITSKIINDDNNYIENIQRNRWEQLHRKCLKRSMGIPRSKVFKGIGGNT